MGTTVDRARQAWARRLTTDAANRDGGSLDVERLVATVVDAVARALPPDGRTEALTASLPSLDAGAADLMLARPEPPTGWVDPWLPGVVHEQAVSGRQRSARGAWYTPEAVVRGLVELATPDGWVPPSAIDPTCGGGAFLLAVLDRFVELGLDPTAALDRIAGTDIDPTAVRVSRWSVALWAAANGMSVDPDTLPIEVADALGDALADAVERPSDRGEPRLVIGNPPFATPLRSGRQHPVADAVRAANRDLLGPYSDLAAVHLLAALRSSASGSVVALVLPQSVLSGRDTAALRRHCHEQAPLQALWATRQAVFDAGVRACAVVLGVGAEPPSPMTLAEGPTVAPVARRDPDPDGPDRWADHAARALGAPALPRSLVDPVRSGADDGSLGDLATATAGFRDEYYGLVGACREWEGPEGEEPNRLVTVGSIDPLDPGWGRVACRLGGRRWLRPTIEVGALEPKVGRWVDQRLTAKVVLATQSRLLEPVVDRHGILVPATPLIAVTADADDLDRVAAVLLAPPIVAWAWQRWFGAALSVDALKLAANQVLDLPLPADRATWDEAAALVRSADGIDPADRAAVAERVAATMNQAYGAGEDVFDWWRNRAARRRPGGSTSPRPPASSAVADAPAREGHPGHR